MSVGELNDDDPFEREYGFHFGTFNATAVKQ